MEGDQIGPKIVWLAPADMATLSPFHNYKNVFLVENNPVSQSAGTTPICFELNLLYVQGKLSVFSTVSFQGPML
jgi:hypothetical protein